MPYFRERNLIHYLIICKNDYLGRVVKCVTFDQLACCYKSIFFFKSKFVLLIVLTCTYFDENCIIVIRTITKLLCVVLYIFYSSLINGLEKIYVLTVWYSNRCLYENKLVTLAKCIKVTISFV